MATHAHVWLAVAAFLSASGCLAGASADPKVSGGRLPAEYRGQPLVWIPKLADIGRLTGRIDSPRWKDAARVVLRDPATRELPKHETAAWLFCSGKALYIGVRAAEPRPDDLVTRGQFWQRDELEVFLEPFRDAVRRPYHHILLDSAGERECHRYHVYPRYFNEHALERPWRPRVEIVTAKAPGAWTCEIKLPFDQLALDGQARAGKTLWRLNLCRFRPARAGDPAMLWSWSKLAGKRFQAAGRFGYALPEAFSSPGLIEEVRRSADPPADPSLARATDPKVQAEVDRALTELGAAAPGKAAAKVRERLKALATEGRAMYGLIEGKLGKAAAEARKRRDRSYRAFRDFAYALDRARPEDDPVPEALARKIAAFEPRRQKGAGGKALSYRLLKPKDYDPSKKYPLLIWLHGSGERGDDNLRQLFSGVWEFCQDRRRDKFRCFLMAPQCPLVGGWADTRSHPDSRAVLRASSNYRMAKEPHDTTRRLLEAFASLQKEFPAIDRDRIYISGSSMGGFGTYECLMRRPELFAAAMPVCGGGDETQAARIAKLPIWIFHGEKDQSVKVQASRNMVAALRKAGGKPKYTELAGAPHDLGSPFLADEVLEWLFSQRRRRP